MAAEGDLDPLRDSLALQRDAAALGFDWSNVDELWAKLAEEIGELKEARTQGEARVLDEFGDLLFVAINLSRHLGVEPTRALAHANEKFRRRFAVVTAGRAQWETLQGTARLDAMERLWQQAKRDGL
ncbi:MAG: MazG nucleotide pyrophosphohydrolase domain-containing protein [Panacagrimonas sp.]